MITETTQSFYLYCNSNLSFCKHYLFLLEVCECLPKCMYVNHITRMLDALEPDQSTSSLELELQMAPSHPAGAGN